MLFWSHIFNVMSFRDPIFFSGFPCSWTFSCCLQSPCMSVADLEGVRGVHSNPPLEPNYYIFMGKFKKIWMKIGKRTPLVNLNPPFKNPGSATACILKSIPNVSHSLSAKRVLTWEKMYFTTHHIFKYKIHCEELKSAHPHFAYCSKRY